jgi:ATP-binding cassette subfamily B protein
MTAVNESRNTAVACLREIVRLFPGKFNFDALVEDEAFKDLEAKEFILALLDKLHMQPDYRTDFEIAELYAQAGRPVLLGLDNGNWICFLGVRRAKDGSGLERVAVYDPLAGEASKLLLLDKDQLISRWHGDAILLKAVGNSGFSTDGKHTAVYSFAAIARSNGVDADVKRILHEFAIEEDEPKERLLFKIISDAGMKAKAVELEWDKLVALGQAFPALASRKDGKFAVLCGVRKLEDELQAVIWDPVASQDSKEKFIFLNQEEFEAEFSGRLILLKKRHSILDEEQPFGLAWFIPEFMRQKKLFGEIALAVLAISAIALVTPLFFQIVVDKVLVHESYTTLNVLGIGIVFVLLFNCGLEYLRGYLLLFATNRIDIRTATRTFQHLMNLPVDFFEKMSSGVLIKHMQQTDKIRGFLSGNLFFTVLELISLVVFIPFLLIYSGSCEIT